MYMCSDMQYKEKHLPNLVWNNKNKFLTHFIFNLTNDLLAYTTSQNETKKCKFFNEFRCVCTSVIVDVCFSFISQIDGNWHFSPILHHNGINCIMGLVFWNITCNFYLPGFHDKLPHINNCLTPIIASKMKKKIFSLINASFY